MLKPNSTKASIAITAFVLVVLLSFSLGVLCLFMMPGRFSARVKRFISCLRPRPAITESTAGRTPSRGIPWSRERYPEQYASDNRTVRVLSPISLDDNAFTARQRYMNVAGMTYSHEFFKQFSYEPDGAEWSPHVQIDYLRNAETFTGILRARRLKPNFAYQIKLRGIFEHRKAFEAIGYLGRWRLPGENTNSTDDDYRSFEPKREAESYLFFDFFVTDEHGNAEVEFYADSSLHVLFNKNWQRKPTWNDSAPIAVECGETSSWMYAIPRENIDTQYIYAENERYSPSAGRGRPAINEGFLPPGEYRAELVLTEESFHGYGDAGFWATVMRVPVHFIINGEPTP